MAQHRIVVVGAGFAGLQFVKTMRRQIAVLILSPYPYQDAPLAEERSATAGVFHLVRRLYSKERVAAMIAAPAAAHGQKRL